MPSSETFSIRPISDLLDRYCDGVVVDPFARNSMRGTITNDLNPETDATHHMDALEFLASLDGKSADVVLFDPPYSPRQVSECYKQVGASVNMQTTQSSFWSNIKEEIGRIVKPSGISITFGWNSGGVGEKYGFKISEILLVAHGGWHNDTICTVEIRDPQEQRNLL